MMNDGNMDGRLTGRERTEVEANKPDREAINPIFNPSTSNPPHLAARSDADFVFVDMRRLH